MSAAAVAPATTTSSSTPSSSSSSSSSASASASAGNLDTQRGNTNDNEENNNDTKMDHVDGSGDGGVDSDAAMDTNSGAVNSAEASQHMKQDGGVVHENTNQQLDASVAPARQEPNITNDNVAFADTQLMSSNMNSRMTIASPKSNSVAGRASSASSSSSPLPADLRRILVQVAKTGSCSWLSWNTNTVGVAGAPVNTRKLQQSQELQQKQNQQQQQQQQQQKQSSSSAPILQPTSSASTTSTAGQTPLNSGGGAGTTTTQVTSAATNAPHTSSSSPSSSNTSSYAIATSTNTGRRHLTATAASAAVAAPPPRKKHRNGLHPRRRFDSSKSSSSSNTSGRKRPLIIRTNVFSSGGATAGGVTASNSATTNPGGQTGQTGTISGSGGSGGANAAGSFGGSGGCSTSASGRTTSGSEPDDSTQYECDSEGTSATTNSELSVEGRSNVHIRYRHVNALGTPTSMAVKMGTSANNSEDEITNYPYRSLKDVFRKSLSIVLDHWYRNRGGYRLSPAEKRRHNAIMASNENGNVNGNNVGKKANITEEDIFLQRRQRLLYMLVSPEMRTPSTGIGGGPGSPKINVAVDNNNYDGPPFTIQRIAEVLIAPERYYTQTHKLCNCLEKLLLVTSSTSAFGGSTGGVTSQSRREERELAALADEKGRLESEFRQRALKRRTSSSLSDENPLDSGCHDSSARIGVACGSGHDVMMDGQNGDGKKCSPDGSGNTPDDDHHDENHHHSNNVGEGGAETSREMLEAAARSLRSKFDHVGIDPHHHPHHHVHHSGGGAVVANHRDPRSIAENRSMTNSPPPPSLGMAAALPGGGIPGGFVRQHLPSSASPGSPTSSSGAAVTGGENSTEHPNLARIPSPILFTSAGSHESSSSSPAGGIHANPNMHMLHMHHAAAMAGVNMGSSGAGQGHGQQHPSSSPHTTTNASAHMAGHNPTSGPSPFDVVIDGRNNSSFNLTGNTETGADLEGRSSASNSDVDSESDDVSFDDSASDRSDGSDSGHYEPFTAARAMALNRMQQQQRLQSRVLTSLHTVVEGQSGGGNMGGSGAGAGGSGGGLAGNLASIGSVSSVSGGGISSSALAAAAGFRLADLEYQSGDSIDSTRGEDSGGSDSSSSDINE